MIVSWEINSSMRCKAIHVSMFVNKETTYLLTFVGGGTMDIGRQSAVDFLDIFVWAAILGSHSHIRIRTCASVTKQYNLKPAKGR